MKIFEQPPTDSDNFGRPNDEMDDLLHAFFKSEMPAPWPKLNLPVKMQKSAPKPRTHYQSRFALAASIAILLLGSIWLAGAFKDSFKANDNGMRMAPAPAHGVPEGAIQPK